MMKILILILSVFPLINICFFTKKNGIISPIVIYSIFYFIRVVPISIMIVFNKYYNFSKENLISPEIINNVEIQFKYIILQFISYIIVIFILWNINNSELSTSIIKTENIILHKKIKYLSIIFFALGLVSFVLVVKNMGGIFYFLNNLNYRTIMVKDAGLVKKGLIFLELSPLIYLYSFRYSKSHKLSPLFWLVLFFIGLMIGLGGRKDLIFILFKSIIFYHIFVNNIKLKKVLTIKNLFFLLAISIVIIVLPEMRKENGLEWVLENYKTLFSSTRDAMFYILSSFSYVTIYMFIISHFDISNYWFGKNFLGLLYAFIPSSIYHNKPPVDDGMYIYSTVLQGKDVTPLIPASQLNLSSYPLETFGSMYANFGILGVLLGFTIVGLVIKKNYKKITKDVNFFTINLYLATLLMFELSTLRIVQFLYFVLVSFLVNIILKNIELTEINT